MHVRVVSGDGEAKFWLEPTIEVHKHVGYSGKQLHEIQKLIEEREDDIITTWRKHFGG